MAENNKEYMQNQKTRAKYICSQDLENAIALANLFFGAKNLDEYNDCEKYYLPIAKKTIEVEIEINVLAKKAGITCAEFFQLNKSKILDLYGIDLYNKETVIAAIIFEPLYKLTGRELNALEIIDPDSQIQLFKECFLNYIGYKQSADNLYRLVNILNEIRKGKRSKTDILTFNSVLIPFINNNNKLEFKSGNPSISAADGVDFDRLRLCEICSMVFWANRLDKETCSLKCANYRRVQIYRTLSDEEKANKKAKRDANKIHKRRVLEIKNKNGTL